eukprot:scpid55140/ scgid32411/ 
MGSVAESTMAAASEAAQPGPEKTLQFPRELDESCVFCLQSSRTGLKVLRCLHIACSQCIKEHTNTESSLTCARCQLMSEAASPGQPLPNSLADWPKPIDPASHKAMCQDSDCEDFQVSAFSHCADCDQYLCEPHSQTHTRNRRRREHRVTALRGDPMASSAKTCPQHPAQHATQFCPVCKIILCEHCSSHTEHRVLELAIAAHEVRHTYSNTTLLAEESHYTRLTQELSAVEQEQDELRHKVQAISDGIGEEFERRHEELRTAEKSLRDAVDNLHWKESKPIELRKEKIVESMRQLQVAHHLQANLSDAVLVKASAKQWPQMYVRTPIAAELASAAESPTVTSIHEIHETVKRDAREYVQKHLSPCVPSTQDVATVPEMPQIDGFLLTYTSRVLGSTSNLFHETDKSQNVHLTDGGRTATARVTQIPKYRSVTGSCTFSYEKGSFAVRIRNTSSSLLVGLARESTPTNRDNSWSHSSGFIGWSSHFPHDVNVLGERLGQPWIEGDVIRIIVDRPNSRIRARHVQSGEEGSLPISRYCDEYTFRAELMDGTSITLTVI